MLYEEVEYGSSYKKLIYYSVSFILRHTCIVPVHSHLLYSILKFLAIIIVSNTSHDLTSSESDLIAGIQKDGTVASAQPEQLTATIHCGNWELLSIVNPSTCITHT